MYTMLKKCEKLATRYESQNRHKKTMYSGPRINLNTSKFPSWSENKSILAEQLPYWSPNGSGHRTSADGAHWPWTLRPQHMAWPCVVMWSGNDLNPESGFYWQAWCYVRLSSLSAIVLYLPLFRALSTHDFWLLPNHFLTRDLISESWISWETPSVGKNACK